jgi:hypothetical protein
MGLLNGSRTVKQIDILHNQRCVNAFGFEVLLQPSDSVFKFSFGSV